MSELDNLLAQAKNIIIYFKTKEAEKIKQNLALGWSADTACYNKCVSFLNSFKEVKAEENTKIRDGEGRIHIFDYLLQKALIEKTIKLSEFGEEGYVYDAKIQHGRVYVRLEEASSEWLEVDPYTFRVYTD